MEENILKKVVAIFLALSILLSTMAPTLIFANDQKRNLVQATSVEPKKVIVVTQNERKESFFSKVINGIKNFVFKANWTMWYYIFVTVGLIGLFKKLEVFDSSDEVYNNIINKDYVELLKSVWSNIKNLPESIKSMYNTINHGTTSTKDVSSFLRDISKTERPIVKTFDYLKVHATLIWVCSLVGSTIGMLGSAVGTFNFGWIYGMTMIPYLWSFKDKDKGDLEILANGVDLFGILWQNSTQKIITAKENVVSFFNTTLPQCVSNFTDNLNS